MAPISCDSGRRKDRDEEVNKRYSLSFKTMKYLSEVGVKKLPSQFIFHEDMRHYSTISTQLHMSSMPTKINSFIWAICKKICFI